MSPARETLEELPLAEAEVFYERLIACQPWWKRVLMRLYWVVEHRPALRRYYAAKNAYRGEQRP